LEIGNSLLNIGYSNEKGRKASSKRRNHEIVRRALMEKISAQVVVHGYVQGVYFRAYTRDQARMLGLTGWVMNRRGGTVEAFFEGEKTKVEQMVAWCRKGPPSAQVDQVEVRYGEFRGEGEGFEVRYG
jgi:acylphosphatase